MCVPAQETLLRAHHNCAVFGATGDDLVIVWAPVYVEDWPCVAADGRVGFINSTSLEERKTKIISTYRAPVCAFWVHSPV